MFSLREYVPQVSGFPLPGRFHSTPSCMEKRRTETILLRCGAALKLYSIFGALLEHFQDHQDTITSIWVVNMSLLLLQTFLHFCCAFFNHHFLTGRILAVVSTSSLDPSLNIHVEKSKQILCFAEQKPFTRWSTQINQGKKWSDEMRLLNHSVIPFQFEPYLLIELLPVTRKKMPVHLIGETESVAKSWGSRVNTLNLKATSVLHKRGWIWCGRISITVALCSTCLSQYTGRYGDIHPKIQVPLPKKCLGLCKRGWVLALLI